MNGNGARRPLKSTPEQRAKLAAGLREALSELPPPSAISIAGQVVADLSIGIGLDRDAFVDLMGQVYDKCHVVPSVIVAPNGKTPS